MKFLALATDGTAAGPSTPEEGQALYDAIYAWFEKYQAQGKVAWMGHQLDSTQNAKTVRGGPDGTMVITDGPFVEAKEGLGGVATFECESMEEAVEMCKAWATDFGLTLELRPIIDM